MGERPRTFRSGSMLAACGLLAWGVLSLVPLPVAAQPRFIMPSFTPSSRFELSDSVQIENIESAARTRLENVRAFLANENWDEAIETLRQVQAAYGDQVVELEKGRYLTVRDYCHLRIARLPPPALRLYRQRVDPQAENWYRQARETADEALLRQIVQQFYCSSRGDDALLLLGEIALERGDSDTARSWWQQISPLLRGQGGLPAWLALLGDDLSSDEAAVLLAQFKSREVGSQWLAYPDTDLPLAEIRARLALVSILAGQTDRAKTEITLLEKLHPQASGRLGGKEVELAAYLKDLLSDIDGWPQPETANEWNTFAGNFTRNKVGNHPLKISAQPTWSAELLNGLGEQDQFPEPDEIGLDALAAGIHPIVCGGQLFYSNGYQVFALDLATGKPAWSDRNGFGQIYPSGIGGGSPPERLNSAVQNLGQPRHTLSRSGQLLFARLGSPITSRPASDVPARDGSFLVCLDLKKQGSLRWRYPSEKEMPGFVEKGWAFEGAPVCEGDFIYVAMRRSDVRPQSHIACFRAADGELVWRHLIASADTPGSTQRNEISHNLLTLHEGVLYANTNLGAVVAVEAASGEVRWAYRYQRITSGDLSRPPAYFFRDLNPCIVAGGLIYVAPTDSESLFALDAATGILAWSTAPTSREASHPVHVLGVSGGKVIATGRNVWWFDAASGKVEAIWPDSSSNAEVGYGRGMLAGGSIYWPTREEVMVFDLRLSGRHDVTMNRRIRLQRPDVPLAVSGGNILEAEDFVVMTSRNRIFAFRQEVEQDATVGRQPSSRNPDD